MSVKELGGSWDLGYALDKHVISSEYIGDDEFGHAKFDTKRTETGESLFQLKYRQDWSQVHPLAHELAASICPRFEDVGLVIPMPASKARARQPVTEVAVALGAIINKPVFTNILTKTPSAAQLKDIHGKEAKLTALKDCFQLENAITNEGLWNALLVDDLFDTGASVEAACAALRQYSKVRKIYVAVLTWK